MTISEAEIPRWQRAHLCTENLLRETEKWASTRQAGEGRPRRCPPASFPAGGAAGSPRPRPGLLGAAPGDIFRRVAPFPWACRSCPAASERRQGRVGPLKAPPAFRADEGAPRVPSGGKTGRQRAGGNFGWLLAAFAGGYPRAAGQPRHGSCGARVPHTPPATRLGSARGRLQGGDRGMRSGNRRPQKAAFASPCGIKARFVWECLVRGCGFACCTCSNPPCSKYCRPWQSR